MVVGFAIFLAVVTFLLSQSVGVRLTFSKETTIVTGPLLPDGQIDFAEAFNQYRSFQHLESEDNGFRHLLMAFHRDDFSEKTTAHINKTLDRLGVERVKTEEQPAGYARPAVDNPLSYIGDMTTDTDIPALLDIARKRLRSAEFETTESEYEEDNNKYGIISPIALSTICAPWTPEEIPFLNGWEAANEAMFSSMVEGINKPHFEVPIVTIDNGTAKIDYDLVGRIIPFPQMAKQLATRMNLRLGCGDHEKALQDLASIRLLAQKLTQSGHPGLYKIGILIEYFGQQRAFHYPESSLSAASLKTYAQLIDSQAPMTAGPEMLYLHRLYIQSEIAARHHSSGLMKGDEIRHFGKSINWNTASACADQVIVDLSQSRDTLEVFAALLEMRIHENLEPTGRFWREKRSKAWGEHFVTESSPLLPEKAFSDIVIRGQRVSRVVLAMLLYEKEHGHLPPAYTEDQQGNKLHSWRTLLLPYLGHQALYEQIRLDEPWDSRHNQQFWKEDLTVFQSSEHQVTGTTSMAVVVGPNTAFPGNGGRRLSEIKKRFDQVAIVVEHPSTTPWMDPTQEPTLATPNTDDDFSDGQSRLEFPNADSHNLNSIRFVGVLSGQVQHFMTDLTADAPLESVVDLNADEYEPSPEDAKSWIDYFWYGRW